MAQQGERQKQPWKRPINHNTNKGRALPQFSDYIDPDVGNWRERAACKGQPVELFFPQKGGGGVKAVKKAKVFCDVCPVAEPCLQYGVLVNDRQGIYGGTTPLQRRAMKRTHVALRQGLNTNSRP